MSLLDTLQGGVSTAFDQVDALTRYVTITREVSGAYNPQTGAVVADADQGDTFSVKAVEDGFATEQIDGVTVKAGDLKLFIQYTEATFAPLVSDKATYQGKEWGIQAVAEHAQTLYELHLRRIE